MESALATLGCVGRRSWGFRIAYLSGIRQGTAGDIAYRCWGGESTSSGTTFDNIFTSTYDTYLVVIEKLTNTLNGGDLQFQLRTSGPTTKATQYYGASYEYPYNSTTIIHQQQSGTSEYTLTASGGDSGQPTSAILYFNNVGPSGGRAKWYGSGAPEGVRTATFGGMNDGSAAYLGLLFKADTGNVTGTVAVYGLAKA